MEGVYIIGIDPAKHGFQLHGARADTQVRPYASSSSAINSSTPPYVLSPPPARACRMASRVSSFGIGVWVISVSVKAPPFTAPYASGERSGAASSPSGSA